MRFDTRTFANATKLLFESPQSLARIASRPVVGRANRSSGPGNAPPIQPSSRVVVEVNACEETGVVAVVSPDASRTASNSSLARSLIAWPNLAGTPMPTSWSTVSDATSSAVSNQFARSVDTIKTASFSPRPTRWHTRMANASSVSTSEATIVVLVSSFATSSLVSSATTRVGRTRDGRAPRPHRTWRGNEKPTPGLAANDTSVAIGRVKRA